MRFAGYAAVFDRVDGGGDVIRKGAFAASLATKREIPLLWQHKAGAVIGRVERIEEDCRGLRVIGEIGGDADALRAAGLLSSGAVNGLSFGYRVGEAKRTNGVADTELGCAAAGGGAGTHRIERSRRPLAELPARLSLGYYDPARDYQAGLAEAGEAGGRTGRAVDFAASVPADRARGLVEARLARLWAERAA